MVISNKTKGLIFILVGTLLVLTISYNVLLQIAIALAGFLLISYGLTLSGYPPFFVLLQRFFDEFRFFRRRKK